MVKAVVVVALTLPVDADRTVLSAVWELGPVWIEITTSSYAPNPRIDGLTDAPAAPDAGMRTSDGATEKVAETFFPLVPPTASILCAPYGVDGTTRLAVALPSDEATAEASVL
jgi:hypothetical protein